MMFWQLTSSDDVVADVRSHRENVTGIIPFLYQYDAHGNFVHFDKYGNVHPWSSISPYLSNYTEMGLEVTPVIWGGGGVSGVANLGQKFIDDAITEALKMGYKGYNFDNELRGKTTESSWAYLKPHAAAWMTFLNTFADALHSHNMTLTVDIQGCCGWVDTEHTKIPAGHCAGVFAEYEFVATRCPMYKESHLDRVYSMGTYSDMIDGNDTTGYHRSPETLFKMVAAAQQAIGPEKYATGIKGGWPYCRDWADPSTCIFNHEAQTNIRYLRDKMGVRHLSYFHDDAGHMPNQAQWDLWGFFLHDQPSLRTATVVI